MFDVGWTELLVIAVVLIVVVGPKDLPPMLRAFGKMTARARRVAGEFRSQFDEALREADLDDVRRTISDAQRLNPVNSLREAMNPLRQMGNDIKADLQKATTVEKKTEIATPAIDVAEPSMGLPETPPVVTPALVMQSVVPSEAAAAPVEKPKPVRKPRTKAIAVADVSVAPVAAPKPKPAVRKAPAKATSVVKAEAAPKKPRSVKKKDEV